MIRMSNITQLDIDVMTRCISLARDAARMGEYPFAAVVSRGNRIITEQGNRAARDRDVTSHAERLALVDAQKILSTKDLTGCSLFTIIEPCAMCSFPIRETRISRVIFAIKSRLMGGYSRWNLLSDALISNQMPDYFGPPPDILPNVMRVEAEEVWETWNPEIWKAFRIRGMFGGPE